MKNRTGKAILLGCLLAAQGVSAETGNTLRNPDNLYTKQVSYAAPAPRVRSHIALIYDEQEQRPLFNKNAERVVPIASITKLMTAMVTLDEMQPLDEAVSVEDDNLNKIRRAKSRLPFGMTLTRGELLWLALMASENRAASALARSYPGGTEAMVAAMNDKARALGMENTRFVGPTGLDKGNVSTANDLVKMIAAAREYPLIRQYSTAPSYSVAAEGGRELRFGNTNPLVKSAAWDIGLSKTGYIHESGLCLVMEANIDQRPVIIVLLNSWGKHTRVGDANRIKKWMERQNRFARNIRES
ncbi:MAG TPA: D-alanyl-D-alanine endopeptidase [Gallionella sp.]